jgi:rhodanese-related sulfurtransferase
MLWGKSSSSTEEIAMSFVSAIPAAPSAEAAAHFARRLALETDCSDVGASMRAGQTDFVLLHVVGSPGAYARRHVPGAIHLRHADMSAERMAEWPVATLFVVYCAGPHCNGADRAALKLALLGRPVKLMIGGVTGWEDEGLPFATGAEPGRLAA